MTLLEMLLISLSLASDAFAVSICKGMSIKNINLKKSLIIASYFSIFQMLMPVIGYFIGSQYISFITNFTHFIVFIILIIIGLKMIDESRKANILNDKLNFKEMLILSIATSMDALAIGISFSLLKMTLLKPVSLIGVITFIVCFIGAKLGNKIGEKYKSKAELLGGIILIIIGLKIIIF